MFAGDLPEEAPPLTDMEEPLALHEEPDDEKQRRKLELGSFTGIQVKDARKTLDDTGEDPEGVAVKRVIENSPGDAAGIREGDILLEVLDPEGRPVALSYPSDWRKVELETTPGSQIQVVYDRAGREFESTLTLTPRVRVPGRKDVERYKEDRRVGVVLRTATEVEARSAGLGPGGGAVVVGLSRRSPWRVAGLTYGDLIVRVGEEEVSHPLVVVDAIREADEDDELDLLVRRDGEDLEVSAALSRRKTDVTEVTIPLLYSYEHDRGVTEWSAIIGLIKHRTTQVAWELRLLWFIRFRGGEADELQEVDGGPDSDDDEQPDEDPEQQP